MGSYSFKNVGKTPEQSVAERLERSRFPIGIKTPIELNSNSTNGSDFLVMHYSLSNTVHDNLRNLLLTNWGERVGLYKFGANLRPLLTEFISQEDFDSAAIERISSAVSAWMPFISLDNFMSTLDRSKNDQSIAKVNIAITYNIPDIDSVTRSLEIILKSM